MIRTIVNLTATAAFGLIVLAVVVTTYHGFGHTIDALPGKAWNFRGAGTTSTPAPHYDVGVDVRRLGTGTVTATGGFTSACTYDAAGSDGLPACTTAAHAPAAPAAPPTPTALTNSRADECDWAVTTLRFDNRLDTAAAAAHPDSREWRDTNGMYRRVAAWWSEIADHLTPCAPLTATECHDDRERVGYGLRSHVLPAGQPVKDWDAQWISNYRRVDALLQELCA